MLEVVEQRHALVPPHRLGALDDVVAVQRADRDEHEVLDLELRGERAELVADAFEHDLVVVDEIHLVDAHDEVRHAEQRRDERVALGLLDDALARIDEDHRQIRGRRPGDHVARVLHVAGGVGDDELAPRRVEVAVGDVDRDALLALGAQAVGEQREVDVLVAAPLARLRDVLELIVGELLGVVEQATDERRLAVVDGAGRREAQQVGVDRRGPQPSGGRLEAAVGAGARHQRLSLPEATIRSSPRACGLPSQPPWRGRRRASRRAR